MAQVTIEGSRVLKTTYLAPGARITVERTKYVDNMIRRGYVNLIAEHEPIRESDSSNVKEDSSNDEPESDTDMLTIPGAAWGAPPSNALKSVWAEFLAEKGVEYPEGSTKLEMIRAWSQSEQAYGRPVD